MERMLLKPTEVAEMLGICLSKAYALIGSGEVPSIRIGASVRVPVERLRECIDQRASKAKEN